MLVAITRAVPSSIDQCELTHLARTPIDVERARLQHAAYEAALEAVGCRLVRLPELADHPDSVFVEDTVVVLDELAVLTRPGAPSRRAEVEAMVPALMPWRALVRINAPGMLDGGDVLRLGKMLYVGLTTRSNASGVEQLRAVVAPHGYEVRGVPVRGALHLKTAVTEVGPRLLLVSPGWIDASAFAGYESLEVDPEEPYAANALRVGEAVIHASEHPRTQARLAAHGVRVVPVEASELAKAEGGVTCCSVVFDSEG